MERTKVVFNADRAIVGRLGTHVAKELLKGKEVIVLNSEKAIISGNSVDILKKISDLRKKGGSSQKGPKISKTPERLLKRMIRGMLPWDRQKGREAWRRLRCYTSKDHVDLKNAVAVHLKFEKPVKFITIKQISDLL